MHSEFGHAQRAELEARKLDSALLVVRPVQEEVDVHEDEALELCAVLKHVEEYAGCAQTTVGDVEPSELRVWNIGECLQLVHDEHTQRRQV